MELGRQLGGVYSVSLHSKNKIGLWNVCILSLKSKNNMKFGRQLGGVYFSDNTKNACILSLHSKII